MTELTPETLSRLQAAAASAAGNAYAPYSNFRVGAALLFEDGTIVSGCNVENIAYGSTLCAERSALCRAVSERGPAIKIVAIAVTNLNGAASPPCGACRQMLSEFVTPEATVYFPGESGLQAMPFSQIFPHAFHHWTKDAHARS